MNKFIRLVMFVAMLTLIASAGIASAKAEKPTHQLPVAASKIVESVRKVVSKIAKVPAGRVIAKVAVRVVAPEELEYTPTNPFAKDNDPLVKEVDFDKK